MKRLHNYRTIASTRVVLAGCLGLMLNAPAAAANDSDQQHNPGKQADRESRNREARHDGDQRRSDSGRQAGPGADMAWIRVGYDFDNDGEFEAYEYIFAYDLQAARRASQERRNMEWDRHFTGKRTEHEAKKYRISGRIESLNKTRLRDVESPHLVAELDTEQGRVLRTDLGPAKRVRQNLQIKQGDRITVFGVRGSLNDRSMLIAHKVKAGEQSLDIERPRSPALRRYNGELIRTRQIRRRRDDMPHIIGVIKLGQDVTANVVLGSSKRFKTMGIREGDTIQFLAGPCRINDKPGLVARSIRINGETYDVNRDRSRQSKKKRSS